MPVAHTRLVLSYDIRETVQDWYKKLRRKLIGQEAKSSWDMRRNQWGPLNKALHWHHYWEQMYIMVEKNERKFHLYNIITCSLSLLVTPVFKIGWSLLLILFSASTWFVSLCDACDPCDFLFSLRSRSHLW